MQEKDLLAMLALVDAKGRPNINALSERLRDLPALRWNAKIIGSQLAHQYCGVQGAGVEATLDDPFELKWCATRFCDFQQEWFSRACGELKLAPLPHRKVWEDAFVLECLRSAGMLEPGKRGVGFGCGEERFPSYFASRGVEVLATDMDPDAQEARGWIATRQHSTPARLHYGAFIDRETFDRQVSFRNVDMNDVPADLDGRFDFCWSVCAFEHLGSIAQGLRFVERSLDLLRPGGIAVHTTEFNYTQADDTIDNSGTVLFRRKDLEQFAGRLKAAGYLLPPISFDTGSTPVDMFIDVPPFPGDPGYFSPELRALHLKLMVDGFPSTGYALAIRKPLR